ncbi:hypothetical protein QVD99_003438 [Batrachochytrium dendrobatidis]|nr:hypothetical protein QVD99_003438 [Batrachochytrium dendrobatidis]
MKLVDILFVLTAAATANAILVPADNDGSPHTSSTSSQVSGPTDKPDPEIPEEDWQEIMDIINSSIVSQDWQDPIDEPSSSISSQNQQQPMDQPIPNTSDEYWRFLMNEISLSTSNQDQQPIDQPNQSTSRQGQQPMSENESTNTVPNQVARLCERYQKTFSRINQRLKLSKEIRNKKLKECREYAILRLRHRIALASGEDISESKYDPEVEVRLKQERKSAVRRVSIIRQQLKRFMKKHGLKFEEPESDSD